MEHQTKIKNADNETVKAGCVVVNDKQEVLLVKDHKKIWTFPKGHVEENETIEQAALRETKEETGYTVQIINRLSDLIYTHSQDGEKIRVAMFLARPLGNPEQGEEGTESAWYDIVTARKILAFNLAFLLDELE
jgi:ADP-ribose pyrophosphatase YjhB (NUDIX family)